MKIYYGTRDNGDGGNSVVFFKDEDYGDAQQDIDDLEEYYGNEGKLRFFTIPDFVDEDSLGLRFTTPVCSWRNQ